MDGGRVEAPNEVRFRKACRCPFLAHPSRPRLACYPGRARKIEEERRAIAADAEWRERGAVREAVAETRSAVRGRAARKSRPRRHHG